MSNNELWEMAGNTSTPMICTMMFSYHGYRGGRSLPVGCCFSLEFKIYLKLQMSHLKYSSKRQVLQLLTHSCGFHRSSHRILALTVNNKPVTWRGKRLHNNGLTFPCNHREAFRHDGKWTHLIESCTSPCGSGCRLQAFWAGAKFSGANQTKYYQNKPERIS